MNKKLFYLTLGVAVIGMTGCSKKLGQFKAISLLLFPLR